MERRESGIEKSNFGQVEFGVPVERKFKYVCHQAFKYVCHQAAVYKSWEIWLKIQKRVITMKRSLKPQEEMRSLRRNGWSSMFTVVHRRGSYGLTSRNSRSRYKILKISIIFPLNIALV